MDIPMDVTNHTPDNYVRCTVIDDKNDVITDTTTSRATLTTPSLHAFYIVYEDEQAFPSNLQGLLPQQVQGWTVVATDGDGEIHDGYITDAEALEIRVRK